MRLKNILTFYISLLGLITTGYADAFISKDLQKRINADPKGWVKIRVEFDDNVDCYGLNQYFKDNNVPIAERPRRVISSLQEQATISQSPVMELLMGDLKEDVQKVKNFWIVNLIILEAKKEAVFALAKIPGVAFIDSEYDRIIPHDPIIQQAVTGNGNKTPGGVEPGLVAINAPAMWALGYTGRGRLLYDYDTGVWPEHPAFSKRFLANRFPMKQCWIGYFSDTPNGNISDHGTHTLGTMAGLVESTADTIGVAFNSYWIANDFVTSTVQELPPVDDMILAFEWALNPDGDINTVNDIPDVINNSWRWRDIADTVQCGGYVVNLMNAIEAAGIANVFSGGNSGPLNTSVNAPQRINTSEVNTFCVGSIDANQAYPYPISNFSTRGPTQCGGVGSLLIHPEVVAPGQNVRSAWGVNSYNTISGTSMAAPHVSGAILLLKEAFPYLSGEELLRALYNTAIDMGDPGEDNTYGKGLIDVYAAFQYLSNSYVPVNPQGVKTDLAVKNIFVPESGVMVCDSVFTPVFSMINSGDSMIIGADITYYFEGGMEQYYSVTDTIMPGDTLVVNLPAIVTYEFGSQEFTIMVSAANDSSDYDEYNNRKIVRFERSGIFDVPFMENFENGLDQNYWTLDNEDGSITWDTAAASGLPYSQTSVAMKLYNYNPAGLQLDGLVSPRIKLPVDDSLTLRFDLSYQLVHSTIADHLSIYVSTDCGNSFTRIFNEGPSLSTYDTITADYVPQYNYQWRTEYLDVTSYAGTEAVFKFETENKSGNNMYLDNIWVYQGKEPLSVSMDSRNSVRIYPNPTQNIVLVEFSNSQTDNHRIEVYNAMGKRLILQDAHQTINPIDLSGFANGLYLVNVIWPGGSKIYRIVKE